MTSNIYIFAAIVPHGSNLKDERRKFEYTMSIIEANTEERIKESYALLQETLKFCRDTTHALLRYASEVQSLRQRPENKPLYEANMLDLLNPTEPNTSSILQSFFSYTQNGKPIIFSSFTEKFLSKNLGFDTKAIVCPEITAEKQHIDLWIKEEQYSVVFENKIKGASYQRNQLGRYIRQQIDRGYDLKNTYIVLLPNESRPNYIRDIPVSTWRCPLDHTANNGDRRCSVGESECWCDTNQVLSKDQLDHCKQCADYYPEYSQRTVVLEDDFAEWLLSLTPEIDSRETILTASITLFADYIKFLYNKRISSKLIKDITNFLREQLFKDNDAPAHVKYNLVLETIKDVEGLKQGLEQLNKELTHALINEWYGDIKKDWPKDLPKLTYERDESFSIEVNGVRIGCWSGTEKGYSNSNVPFWGFYGDSSDSDQRTMVKAVLDSCGITPEISESGNWIAWDSIKSGEDNKCKDFFKALEKLGYL